MIDLRTLSGANPSRVLCALDYGNVNRWFLDSGRRIELHKLRSVCAAFSNDTRLYYGHDPANLASRRFLAAQRAIFGRRKVITKPIQKIRTGQDRGAFHAKSNFDVEIAVDAMKAVDGYDSFILFSGDSDFAYLAGALKAEGKQVGLVHGGYISRFLRGACDFTLSAVGLEEALTIAI